MIVGMLLNDKLDSFVDVVEILVGLNFRIPFVEEIQEVDIRDQIYSVKADAYTSDTQSVNELQLKLNYRYSSAMLSNIIRETGINNVENKLLVPNVAKIAKDAKGEKGKK